MVLSRSRTTLANVIAICLLWSPQLRSDAQLDTQFTTHSPSSGQKNGVTVKQLSESCVSDQECEVKHMHSLCKNGACACKDNFTLFQDLNVSACISGDHLDTEGISDNGWSTSHGIETRTMIPIIVVLGIMFIGMCVALQLFSRARFRNQRTIFNSPHPRLMHIKLGKKRKSNSKRSSHISLHVPVSRRPSNYSQPSHPSPRSMRSVTPSGSQEVLSSPVKEHPESPANPEGSSKGETRQMKGLECSVNGRGAAVSNQVYGPHSSTATTNTRSQSNAKSPSPPTQV